VPLSAPSRLPSQRSGLKQAYALVSPLQSSVVSLRSSYDVDTGLRRKFHHRVNLISLIAGSIRQ
jgi:hypothetical protein